MADLHHEITIAAAPEHVYAALTTPVGLQSWWTEDTVIDPRPGGMAEFGFMNHSVVFRMRIEEQDIARGVTWSCIDGPNDWVRTSVQFRLSAIDGGKCKVSFLHADARTSPAAVAERNTTWGCLMRQLKCYVEGSPLAPVFPVRA